MQVHVRAPIQAQNAKQGVRNEPNAIMGLFRVPSSALRVNSAPVPQQLRGGFRKPVFVGASPTRGSILRSEPAQAGLERRMPSIASGRRRAFANLAQSYGWQASLHGDHDVTAASRPVKAFVPVRIRLVTPISMGRQLQVILHAKGRSLAMRGRPDESPGRVRVPQRRSPPCDTTCPSQFAEASHSTPAAQNRIRELALKACAASRTVP